MRVFLAEKPIQGETIALALNKNSVRRDGYYECGPPGNPMRDVVTWANGHLYKLAEWDLYEPALAKWDRLDLLPVRPLEWVLVPDKDRAQQIATINGLIANAEIVVNCCDVDREGQFIGDTIIKKALELARKAGKDPSPKLLRLCNVDGNSVLSETTIEDALRNMRSNDESDFVNLGQSAYARAVSDQIYGFCLTRKCSVDGRSRGWRQRDPISVGRVQTPTLALIVKRDKEIENFQPKTFYGLHVQYEYHGKAFVAEWKPSEESGLVDEDGHITDKTACLEMLKMINGVPARVLKGETTPQTEKPPLPHSLSSLQIQASHPRFGGLTAKEVLAAAQRLYERYRLISYPRTNCRYLPMGQLSKTLQVLHAIAKNDPSKADLCQGANPKIDPPATFNDAKVGTHHAIVPLARTDIDMSQLTPQERTVYGLICSAYIAQFYPAVCYERQMYVLGVSGQTLIASERTMTDPGWRKIYGNEAKAPTAKSLPAMPKDAMCKFLAGVVPDGKTQPPSHYADGTLVHDMVEIHKHIEDADLRARLERVEGIGTDATRDDIIETLLDRRYIKREGRFLISTRKGRILLESLPQEACSAGLTALDEYALQRIVEGAYGFRDFVDSKIIAVSELLPRVHMKPGHMIGEQRGDGSASNARPRRSRALRTGSAKK